MKFAVLTFAALLVMPLALMSCTPADGPDTRHVLFIGNSFTSNNDMPETLEKIARSAGKDMSVTMVAHDGYTLQNQLEDSSVLSGIDSRTWDAVILQEQSQRFAFRRDQVEKDSFGYGEGLVERIRQHSPKAHVVWYQTWGYKHGDQDNCANIPEICSREGMEQRIAANTAEMARRTKAEVADVSDAWQQFRQGHPDIELYDADGKHPSAIGSQLAARAIYAALFPEP